MAKNLNELRRFLDKITKPDSDHFLGKVLDQVYLCLEMQKPCFTEFLDPARRNIAAGLLKSLADYGVFMHEDGGYAEAERKMLGFAAKPLDATDFPIGRVKLSFDPKFGALTHRDILGATLGLGLNRAVVGDVVMLHQGAVILAETSIARFVADNLFKIGRVSVASSLLADDEPFFGLDNRVTERIICASLRLDAVLAATFKQSRGDTAALIKSGKAQVNWQQENSGSKQVKPGDMLTLRRFGRVLIKEICGKSRKDKVLLDVVRY